MHLAFLKYVYSPVQRITGEKVERKKHFDRQVMLFDCVLSRFRCDFCFSVVQMFITLVIKCYYTCDLYYISAFPFLITQVGPPVVS